MRFHGTGRDGVGERSVHTRTTAIAIFVRRSRALFTKRGTALLRRVVLGLGFDRVILQAKMNCFSARTEIGIVSIKSTVRKYKGGDNNDGMQGTPDSSERSLLARKHYPASQEPGSKQSFLPTRKEPFLSPAFNTPSANQPGPELVVHCKIFSVLVQIAGILVRDVLYRFEPEQI